MKLSTNDILVVVFVCLALITGRFAFSQGTQNLDTSLIEDLLTETSGVSTPTIGGVPDDSVTFDSGDDATDAPKPDSIWSIIRAGGIVGWVIILLSVAAGALIIEHLLTIRRSALIPQELADRLFQLVKSGERAKAVELCQANPGFLSNVTLPALMQPWSHWDYVEKAAEDALAEQTGRLYRKVDWLSLIGNIAPMLGLLGTVIGMIVAFRELSLSDGMARGADLAEGIYLALVTTVEGLLVAIPTLAIHSLLTNRVTTLAGDVAFTVEQILRPIKFAVKKTESTQ